MTPEIEEILKKISSAKGITFFLVIFFLGVFIWKNLDFLTEVSFTFRNNDQEAASKSTPKGKEASGSPQLSLGEIILPPNPEKLPSIVVFEIQNPGTATAINTHISIDYGAAKVISYEVIGLNSEEFTGSPSTKSIITIDITKLRPNESAYIYAHTSFPSFKRISISSENVTSEVTYTYKDYLENRTGDSTPTFSGFLLFLLGGVLLIVTIFFTFGILGKLNKKFGFGW